MAETPDVNIRFRVRGARRIDQALQGIRTNIQKANKDQRSEAKRTEREVAQSAKRRTSKEKTEAARAADAVEKAERRKRRAYNDTAREEDKNDRRAEKRDRNRRRRRRRGGRGGGMLAGAGAVAGAAIIGARMAGQQSQGIVGVRSQQDVVSSMVNTRANLVRNVFQGLRGAGDAGASMASGDGVQSLTNNLVGRAAQIGVDRGVSTEEIMNAMAASQTEFSQLATAFAGGKDGIDRLMASFDTMAMVSQATGTSMESTSRATFALMRSLGLGADEVDAALGIIAQQALDGSISLDDFANQFPEILSTFRGSRGTSGTEALSEFSGLVQALQSGATTSPEKVRTGAEAFMRELSTKRVQRALRRRSNGGINVLGEDGNLRNLGDIVSELTAAGLSSTQMNNIFGGEAARAAMQLTGAERDSGLTMNERIQGATPEQGLELLRGSFDAVMNDPVGQALDARADREANMAVATDELIERFSRFASLLGELEDRFPTASIFSGPIATVGMGAMGALGLKAMMGGGGGGMLASMGAGIKGLFTVAGMGALAAKGAVIAGGSVVGGALGYGLGGLSDRIEGTHGTSSGMQAAQRQAFDMLIDPDKSLFGAIIDGFRELREGPTMPERPSERGARTIELGQRSINGIAQAAQANAPGSGRRTEGGPTERN